MEDDFGLIITLWHWPFGWWLFLLHVSLSYIWGVLSDFFKSL